MNLKTQKILINVVCCLAFLSIPIITSPDFNSSLRFFKVDHFQSSFLNYVFLLTFFFANYYWFIPNFFHQNKKTTYCFIIVICFIIVTFLPNLLIFHTLTEHRLIPPDGFDNFPEPPDNDTHFLEIFTLIPFLLTIALSFLLKINSKLNQVQNEKQLAEISYLKAQINPHFLFNTLNSLYALTLEKSSEAPNAVLKLSNMMRYVVTESAENFVSLEKEINHIKDYIDLQKLRIDDEVNLKVAVEGNPVGKAIAPLILIPFVENAFKYGINPDENSFIEIKISLFENNFTMIVRNSIVNTIIPDELKSEKGLENTTRRLEYIYPKKHNLTITENNTIFDVNLQINLG